MKRNARSTQALRLAGRPPQPSSLVVRFGRRADQQD
jgi:hypothetical protein